FQDNAYLRSWCTPAISALLLERGVVLRPDLGSVVYGGGAPMRCHENALTYATLQETATAYFGFGLYRHKGRWLWWLHSYCIEADGRVIDSSAEPCALYIGIPWREVYPLIPKKSGAVCAEDLPPILQAANNPEKFIRQVISPTRHHRKSPLATLDFIGHGAGGGNGVAMRKKQPEGTIYWRYIIFSILFGGLLIPRLPLMR
ncbi:MAG: hypothetical protein ABL983_20790, partial [Nitrospira sp.]